MVYSEASAPPPPLYSSTGSLHGDIADLQGQRRRRTQALNSQNNGLADHRPASTPTTSVEIRRSELPDYTTAPDAMREQTLAISDFLVDDDEDNEMVREQMEREVVAALFRAVENGQDEIINAFMSSGLATVQTKDRYGRTTLGAACEADHIRIVQQLVDFGADVNEFSTSASLAPYRAAERVARTPLMIAAERGNLPLVKLLLDVYKCDDSLVAPDGQLALRLAASNKHKEIVDYMPTRRGGGMKRWKYKNQKAIARMKSAGHKIYVVGKFFVWDVPKFFVWTFPKHAIVLPLSRKIKYLHENRAKLLGWIWTWLVRTAKATIVFAKKLPGRTWRFAKAFSRFTVRAVRETARILKELVKYIYKATVHFITESLPRAAKKTLEFIWSAITSIVKMVGDFVGRVFSALHTFALYVLRFIKGLTLKDVWNGFVEVLSWIFVTLPKTLWEGLGATGKFMAWLLKSTFGWLGECVLIFLEILKEVIIYIPKLVWQILTAVGDILKRGTDEIRVWINPKASV